MCHQNIGPLLESWLSDKAIIGFFPLNEREGTVKNEFERTMSVGRPFAQQNENLEKRAKQKVPRGGIHFCLARDKKEVKREHAKGSGEN